MASMPEFGNFTNLPVVNEDDLISDLAKFKAFEAYLFVCVSTGSADHRLYASHTQFPIALHQFLTRAEAEHFTCKVIYVDTHSANLSAEAGSGVIQMCYLTSVVRNSTGNGACRVHGTHRQEKIDCDDGGSSSPRTCYVGVM